LIRPDKNINNVKTKSIKKKIKDKIFAQSVSREKIKLCEKTLNIKLDVFIESVLESIKKNMNFKID
jgi:predicted hydrolase (HD superfamily)